MITLDDDIIQINIGKKGITDEIIEEVAKMLNKRKIVNVKLLRSAIEGKNRNEINDMLETLGKKSEAKIGKKVTTDKPRGFKTTYRIEKK